MVQSWESNPRPSALQSRTLSTELILLQLKIEPQHICRGSASLPIHMLISSVPFGKSIIMIYYIDTDEIPGFFQ